MNKPLRFTALVFLSGCTGYFGAPWWLLAPLSGIVALTSPLSQRRTLVWGFVGGALSWLSAALMLHIPNEGILAHRIGNMLGGLSPVAVLLATATLGGLLGGLGAASGRLLGDLIMKK
jgi:hypothetical protein